MARPNRAWVAPLLLALMTLALTLWFWRWAVWNHSWGPDEELYRHFARGISLDFNLFVDLPPTYGRGVQRLHLLLLAAPMMLFKNPAAFAISHLLFVSVYASAAIPAWLIARGCGVDRYAALVPATLVVLTPWSVISTSFLTESVGYGVFAWAFWATWRAAVRPSVGADVLAVLLMVLAVLARTGFLLLLPVLPAVAVLQAWRYGTGEGSVGTRLRRLAPAALRRQPLSVGLGLLGVAVIALAWARVIPGGPERFTGSYATALPPLWLILSKWRSFLSRIDAGTGFLLFAVAVPWVFWRVARAREPGLHALAWTALLASLSVLLSLVGGPADERYVMFVAFPVVLAACVALFRRDVNPIMLVLGGAAALALFFTPGWRLIDQSDFAYFGFPTESFMSRVVLTKLGNALSSVDPRTSGGVLVAVALVALVVLAWRRPRWVALALVPAAFLQLAVAGYAIDKHDNTVGARSGPGLRARSWVDQHVPRGERVGVFAVSNGLTGDYNPIWREIQYWNTTLRSVVKFNSPITQFPGADAPYPFATTDATADLDPATGRVDWKGGVPFPRYVVIPQPPLSVTLDWQVVARTTYIPATLVQVARPLQARTTLAGVTPQGYTDPASPATLTVFGAARPQPRCLFVDLVAAHPKPGARAAVLGYRIVRGEQTVARGSVPAGELRREYLPVSSGSGPSDEFTIRTHGKVTGVDGVRVGLQVGNYEAQGSACPS